MQNDQNPMQPMQTEAKSTQNDPQSTHPDDPKGKESKGVKAEIVVVSPEEQEKRREQDRTTRNKADFLRELDASYGMIIFSCERIGIAHKTYREWCKNDPAFAEANDEILYSSKQYTRDKLTEQIRKGNIAAIIFYLKCKDEEFRPQVIVQTKTLEDLIKELNDQEDDDDDDDDNDDLKLDAKTDKQTTDPKALLDSGQTIGEGTLPAERGAEAVVEKTDAPQHHPEGAAKGADESN